MKMTVCVAGAFVIVAVAGSSASAGGALTLSGGVQANRAPANVQLWTAGWDKFSEPLDYTKSKVTWELKSSKLTVTYVLHSAVPTKLYQVVIHFFCDQGKAPNKKFGQFPVGACGTITRQGVTASVTSAETGVVLTDINGTGSFKVVIGPVKSGTYAVEFGARDGAGCYVNGGGGNGSDCNLDFQSPGPTFGDTTMIVVP